MDPASLTAVPTPGTGNPGSPARAERLDATDDMLRELSRQTEPQRAVEIFRHRFADQSDGEYLLSLSRRGLQAPFYRITRHTDWPDSFDPWKRQSELPLLHDGLLGTLIYGDRPSIVNNVQVAPNDPGRAYLKDARSILGLPQYDSGVALNMVVRMSREPNFFNESKLPDMLVMTNLFGRATKGLVLAKQLEAAHAELDHELQRVGLIQRQLLPQFLPAIPGARLAVSYETATRAGGDYYDVLPLNDGRWGIIIADVSGHGAPAAVVMTVVRTLLHTQDIAHMAPDAVLSMLNRNLDSHFRFEAGMFVTAFYAVYEPAGRRLHYSCAGHNPPMIVDSHCHSAALDGASEIALGIDAGACYQQAEVALREGDTLVLYTDGITEAANLQGEAFGIQRLRSALCRECCNPGGKIQSVMTALASFVGNTPRFDDQTLLVMRVDREP